MSNLSEKRSGYFKMPNAVTDRIGELGPAAYCIYGIIGSHDYCRGESYPSQRRIRALTRFGHTTIVEAIDRLESIGLIEVIRLSGRRNTYRILAVPEALPSQERPEQEALPSRERGDPQPGAERSPAGNGALPSRERNKKNLRRRTEEDKPKKKKTDPLEGIQWPEGMDTAEVRASLLEWIEYKRVRKQAYKQPAQQLSKLLKNYSTPAELIDAVEHSIGNNFSGVYPPKGNQSGQGRNSETFRPAVSSRIR